LFFFFKKKIDVKKHPFLKNVNWEDLRNQKSPFVPKIEDETDTSYFDGFFLL